jgi:putative membrane protein
MSMRRQQRRSYPTAREAPRASTPPPTHRAAVPSRDDVIPQVCLAIFTGVWIDLAIAPRYRADWLLENLLTFVCVPAAVLTYRRFRFTNQAYVQATIFLILHTIGSHYTYSEVPLGDWVRDALGFSRNHYDRLVHFAFGVLMLRPSRELAIRRPWALGRGAVFYLSFTAVAWWSVCYEIIEWIVASVADPAAGTAYLGTQGDIWDAQKDSAFACAGALIGAAADAWQLKRARALSMKTRRQ